MPTRNANSVAATRLVVPNSSATKIVAAEREVPGNTPATTCAMPTRIATVQLIAVRSPSAFARLAAKCSATTIQTTQRTSAQAIGVVVWGRANAFQSWPNREKMLSAFFTARPSAQVTPTDTQRWSEEENTRSEETKFDDRET